MSDADLRAQLAALTAERDALKARVAELAPTWRQSPRRVS
jgi:cell division protein FtsB